MGCRGHAPAGRSVVAAATDALGDIDLVLVAAGILGDQARAEADVEHAVDILTINLVGVAAAMLPAAERLRTQGHGTIVVFSSVAGLRGRRANYVYGASKAGLDALAEGVQSSLAGSGAKLLVVRPGFVRTKMTAHMERRAVRHHPGRGRRRRRRSHPQGPRGHPRPPRRSAPSSPASACFPGRSSASCPAAPPAASARGS